MSAIYPGSYRSVHVLLHASVIWLAAACGGGGEATDNGATPGATTSFSVVGAVTSTKPLANTTVTVFGADGRSCATGSTDSRGEYSVQGTCKTPALIVADTPERTGSEVYAVAPASGSRTNLTPMSVAATQLVLGASPTPGSALNASLITRERVSAANGKLSELIQPIATKMGLGTVDFASGPLDAGAGMATLLEVATITSEVIPSAAKQLIRVQLASEHRPVVLARDTRQDLGTAAIDTGLGIALDLIDEGRLRAMLDVLTELRADFEGAAVERIASRVDTCFRHNGTQDLRELYDMPEPFSVSTATTVSNLRLQRYNIYTNFTNETEEQVNVAGGTLAQVSWDFVDGRGMPQRAFTWLVKGSQALHGCQSAGAGWRVLGNQRPLYVRSSTYALHKVLFNSSFAGRTDTYGTGGEFFIGGAGGDAFTYALISGPGLQANGGILYRHDGAYLRYNGTVNAIRSAALTGNFKPIHDAIEDSRAFVMSDAQVREVADGFFAPQNRYVIRLFAQPQDLFPALTIVDTLPKRPYLPAEVKAGVFPSVAVNLDSLVTALQTNAGVTVNWSLPTDTRGQPLVPRSVAFMRKNCAEAAKWPGCSARSAQVNEYSLGQQWMFDLTQNSVEMLSPRLPPTGSKTFESHIRVHALDSLARPLEVSVGMTYQR